MPSECRYTSSDGTSVELDGMPTLVGTALDIRGHEWGYDLGSRSLSARTLDARKATLQAVFTDLSQADLLRRLADRDMRDGTPGTLTCLGEWSQRAYVTSFEPSGLMDGEWAVAGKLGVALLDGQWRRERMRHFLSLASGPGADWLDLPTDAPYDLMGSRETAYVEAHPWGPSPVRLTFWGPCVDPAVTIGGNTYRVNATVTDGARVEVDGLSFPRTIELVSRYGDRTDLFAAGERGNGEGSGSYIFQPLPPGRSEVSFSGSFGVDVYWYEQESEVPWSS